MGGYLGAEKKIFKKKITVVLLKRKRFLQVCFPGRCIPGYPVRVLWSCTKCLLDLGHSCWRSLQLLCCVPAALWSCLFWCFFLHCVSVMKSKLWPCGGTGTCFSVGAALVLRPLGDLPLPPYVGCSAQKKVKCLAKKYFNYVKFIGL